MTFASSASAITQTGTDTDMSGMSGLTGVTTHTAGPVSIYVIDSARNLTINGTCSMDATTEMVIVTSTTVNSSLLVGSSGSFTVGAPLTSSYGRGEPDLYPNLTALILSKDGPGCCSNGSMTINGALNLYGAAIRVQACVYWTADCSITIREGIIFSEPNVTGSGARRNRIVV